MDKQIDAFLNGGEKQLAIVKTAQEKMDKQIGDIAQRLMQTFGIDLPTALGKASDYVFNQVRRLDAFMADLQSKRTMSTQALQAEFGQGAFAFNVDVGNRAIGGGAKSYADAVAVLTREFSGADLQAAIQQLGQQAADAGAIPSFAGGGIVPGAPGSPQLVLAHGGEVIGSGGGTINLTVQIGDKVIDDLVVAATVRGRREGRL